jgi:hypothetical protein
MTQAVNLANFANNLDSSGGVSPAALNAAVPIAKGGTNATTASAARTSLGLAIGTDIPSSTGTGASGTWGINVTGSSASLATTNWTVLQSGTSLLFRFNGANRMSLDSSGNLTVIGNVTAYGTL